MCFFQRHSEVHKTDQTDAAHSVLSQRNEGALVFWVVVYKLAKVLVLLTMK